MPFRLVNLVYRKETRVLVENSGIPVAALVSAEDLERLAWLDRECERLRSATRYKDRVARRVEACHA